MEKTEAKWIVDYFDTQCANRGFKNGVKECYLEAERILRGWDKIQPRSCSCEYPALTRMVHSMREQYDSQIMELYNEQDDTTTSTKRGRKSK